MPGEGDERRAQKGRGIRLSWAVPQVETAAGATPELEVRLCNDRSDRWSEVGPPSLAGVVHTASGERVSPTWWLETLVGREYDLGPGECAPIFVSLKLEPGQVLQPGGYDVS